MSAITTSFCIASLLSVVTSVDGRAAIVDTSLGPVEGHAPSILRKCGAFYGVPYAAPPTGENRFKPPQPHTPWEKPRSATHVGKSCLQGFGDSFVPLPNWAEEIAETFHLGMEAMSEDCLYLNVFTPHLETDEQGLPVMVWFHGGSYMGGSGDKQSGLPFYDGHILCGEGDVVVVTVNYRLGIFGFFASQELLDETGTAGNMGIQDQRQSLEWVQANIRQFGGDASRVTIFGESAGAGAVVSHLASWRSAPLFSAAIMQSGGFWPLTLTGSFAGSARISEALSCTSLDCLRGVGGRQLLHAMLKEGFFANPVPDGFEWPLGVQPRDVLASGNFSAKPMMVGTNRNESALFDCASTPELDETAFRAKLAELVQEQTGNSPSQEHLDRLVTLYNASQYDDGNPKTWPWKRALIDANTDMDMFCDSRTILDSVAQQGQPTFAYQLEHPAWFFKAVPCLGTPHMTDLFFLWQNFDPVLTPGERALGARMAKYWSSFAWRHTPGDTWPEFGANRFYLELDVPDDRPVAQLKREQCDLFDAIRAGGEHRFGTVLV